MFNHQEQATESLDAPEGPGVPFSSPTGAGDGERWEPRVPSIRSIAPSVVAGAVVPLAVYYLVRPHVGSDADALIIGGIPAAAWVVLEFLRRRRIDPVGAIVLFGFVAGVLVSFALGGNAFVLKVRDSGFTFLFGLASIVSTRFGRRPVTFYIGRALTAGSDPERTARYDELWEVPAARATFRLISLIWGVGLVAEAATRVVIAAELTTKAFLAVSPVVTGLYVGSMFLATMWLVARSRARAPLVRPEEIPPGGGGTWWWLRVYLRPAGRLRPDPSPGG